MNVARTRRLKVAHTTEGLLLRLVPYGESDAVVTLLTHDLGKVSAMARGLRRGRQGPRPVVLEPMHTLRLQLDESPGVEMMVLREARLERVRHRLVRRLDELEVAGQGLRWVRALAPPRAAEPGLWAEIEALLDHLDQPTAAAGASEGSSGRDAGDGQGEVVGARGRLAGAGLRMLGATGYGFELLGCARCGKECPEGAVAAFDPRHGGLVCQACGGGPHKLRPELRAAMMAATEGDDGALPEVEVEAVLDWVETALAVHLNVGDARHETRESRLLTMADHVLTTRPVRVKAPRGARVFEIEWADGMLGKIPHELLRGYCPCAGCQGHTGSIKFVAGGDQELEKIDPVGNYALQLTWGDRHDGGLYSFRYLRSLCEMADRQAQSGESDRPALARL